MFKRLSIVTNASKNRSYTYPIMIYGIYLDHPPMKKFVK